MIAGLLAVFSGPYAILARWAIIAALAASIAVTAWIKGDEHGTEKLTNYKAEQALAEVRIAKARTVVSTRVVTKFVKVKGDAEIVNHVIEKEVIKYAEKNPGYCLDVDWRVQHDAAATGVLPKPSGGAGGQGRAPGAVASTHQ